VAVRGAHGQALSVECLNDFGREDRLELLHVRVLVSQIAEHIPASAHYFQLFGFHRNISFNLFKRSLIRSISRFGVLLPWVHRDERIENGEGAGERIVES